MIFLCSKNNINLIDVLKKTLSRILIFFFYIICLIICFFTLPFWRWFVLTRTVTCASLTSDAVELGPPKSHRPYLII
jgi:amino acid permease